MMFLMMFSNRLTNNITLKLKPVLINRKNLIKIYINVMYLLKQ